MSFLAYLKKYGLRQTFITIWRYKIDELLRALIDFFVKKRPLKNIIVIESHNDFDCNGGAFYNYLIANNYNQKYKIVWTTKNPISNYINLPFNVTCVPLFRPSIRKDYYFCIAKFFLSDCEFAKKTRNDQVSVYCTHGGCTFKNVKGLLVIPDYIDYILCSSENYAPLMCENYSVDYPNNKMVNIGFPSNDLLFDKSINDIRKLIDKEYNKLILWLPTFRKLVGGRDDGGNVDVFGIPLIKSIDELIAINNIFVEHNSFLIIKFHPMQDLSNIIIPDGLTNIIFVTGSMMKDLDLDIYVMMKDADAMISDYSSSAYAFLQLNRPMGFVISDLDSYKRGFSVENFNDVLVGDKISTIDELLLFFKNIFEENDRFRQERSNLLDWLYKYNDGQACRRLAEFLNL